MIGELVEDKHWAVPLGHQFCQAADIQVKIGIFNVTHFAYRVRRVDELSQGLIWH